MPRITHVWQQVILLAQVLSNTLPAAHYKDTSHVHLALLTIIGVLLLQLACKLISPLAAMLSAIRPIAHSCHHTIQLALDALLNSTGVKLQIYA